MRRHRILVVAAAVATSLVVPLGWVAFERGAAVDQSRHTIALLTGVYVALLTAAIAGLWRRPTDPRPRAVLAAAVAVTVSYFRLLQPPTAATLGALVWFATPALVMIALTAPSVDRPLRLRWWSVAFAVLGLLAVLASGPSTPAGGPAALRAASWAYYDAGTDRWLRQENPLARSDVDALVVITWAAWAILVLLLGIVLVRRCRGWAWRAGLGVASLATIVLAVPQRTSSDGFLLGRQIGDLVTALPVIVVAVFAGWAIWAEIVTPRLIRPSALVLQLDPDSTAAALRQRLARAVGDPSATVVFARNGGWVDGAGVELAAGRASRRLVTITRAGESIAGLDLDAAADVAPDLLQQAAGAVVLTLDAQRLAALAAAAAAEARDSAQRLLEVEQMAITDISRRITDGPDHTLTQVDELLDERPLPLTTIHRRLLHALEQVREIAHRSTPGSPGPGPESPP